MSSTTEVLAVLRERINEMRRSYNDIRVRARRMSYQDVTLRDTCRRIHYRLSYLVPLHRALANVVQQQGSEARAGELQYLKCFEKLRSRGRIVVAYTRMGREEMYFGAEMADLRLLVPASGVPASEWSVRRLADIVQSVRDDLAAEHQASVMRAMLAKEARATFLASLTVDQRSLLRVALDSAKASGASAVSFNHRDLEVR